MTQSQIDRIAKINKEFMESSPCRVLDCGTLYLPVKSQKEINECQNKINKIMSEK